MPTVPKVGMLQSTGPPTVGIKIASRLNMNGCHSLGTYRTHVLTKIAVVLLAVLYVRLLVEYRPTDTKACLGRNVDSSSLSLGLTPIITRKALQHSLSAVLNVWQLSNPAHAHHGELLLITRWRVVVPSTTVNICSDITMHSGAVTHTRLVTCIELATYGLRLLLTRT